MKFKFDNVGMQNHQNEMIQVFRNLSNVLLNIEKNFDNICVANNWNSETRNYFYNKYKALLTSFNNIENKIININAYIDQVITSHNAVENNLNIGIGSNVTNSTYNSNNPYNWLNLNNNSNNNGPYGWMNQG